jgi:hypothetical protein
MVLHSIDKSRSFFVIGRPSDCWGRLSKAFLGAMRSEILATSLMAIGLFALVGLPRAQGVQLVASQDTWITELAPDLGTLGTGTILAMRSSNPAGQNAQPYVQFGISSLTTNVFSASLNLTADQTSTNPSFVVHVFGGFQANAGTWSEAGETTPTWNSAALKFPDGVGLVAEIGDGSTLLDQWDLVPDGATDDANAKVTFLGSVTFTAVVNGTMSFSSPALVSFLNAARTNGDATVTFVLAAEPHAINSNFRMYSKEATDDLGIAGVDTLLTDAMRPLLVINEVIPGDFDADLDVDGADFVAWQTNFPTSPAPGASPIPEPCSLLLGAFGGLGMLRWRKSMTARCRG